MAATTSSGIPTQQHIEPQTVLEFVPAPHIEKTIEEKVRAAFPEDADTAVRVMMCESSASSTIVNNNPATGDYSVGVFQINLYGELAKERPSEEWLKNPDNNIAYARTMWEKRGWRDWSCARGM